MYFSIVIPIYNVDKYLRECVDSILAQSFTDYELILVNDGSTDTSPEICDEYAKKDKRITVIHKANSGSADSRNVGTSNANGEYIIYVDSDDFIISADFLADIYDKTQKTSADLVLYKFQKYYQESGLANCSFSLDFGNETQDIGQTLLNCVKADAYYGMAWIKAIRGGLIEENNIRFEKGIVSGEDMDWYFNILFKAKTIDCIDKSYIAYRQREGSVSATNKIKNLSDFICVLEKWYSKLQESELSEMHKKALLGAMAKYYSNLLITYSRVKDRKKKDYKSRMKKLSVLLDYSLSSRPKTVKKVYSVSGFSGTILMLKILDKIKGR